MVVEDKLASNSVYLSIHSYIVATKVKTVLEPVHLDAGEPWEKWAGLPKSSCDIILSINMFQYCSFGTIEVKQDCPRRSKFA